MFTWEMGDGMKHKIVPVLIVAFLTLFVSIFGNRLQAVPLNQQALLFTISTAIDPALTEIPAIDPATPLLRQPYRDIVVTGQVPMSPAIKEAPSKNKAIINFLFDFSEQPYWLRLASAQSQSLTFNRMTSETKAAEALHYKLARHSKQSELILPLSCSRNLLEGLPPGFFLLI
jgi:hypothetical protein